ncbi:hypothetical protein AB205_0005290 [Aquarana catesbeiana]|uniref:Uncharacterized protein n=1 Tax=Aquarana catesbeiana TaxID=8400 RepID=A0A2G9PQV8_AQUCT|nr:hypothetical protein AB205_0005290 [Aquarana catesbeiana]
MRSREPGSEAAMLHFLIPSPRMTAAAAESRAIARLRLLTSLDSWTECNFSSPPSAVIGCHVIRKLLIASMHRELSGNRQLLCCECALSTVYMRDVSSALWVSGLDSSYLREQMLNEPLVREMVRECTNIPLSQPQQGEAVLASFKPRGYSECIVTAGGEERV